ncbi:hypothetical protein TUBRATIS_000410 [Tubulinosema ratisbonensis]|uniref:Uncharacterized protein n=1 Tax=Tubulinosema ratisbonensis TaxID=291195 RepID=A0A437AQX7_9MICR|nr:hypothetical protein TUBRATIS_000410 [Tubulinosema ratisbonensis]
MYLRDLITLIMKSYMKVNNNELIKKDLNKKIYSKFSRNATKRKSYTVDKRTVCFLKCKRLAVSCATHIYIETYWVVCFFIYKHFVFESAGKIKDFRRIFHP